ncbi:PspC domain-containing protein [Streptomyces tsukubensis]|uniref:PspC domain-containing protein n=1 Tax=Streptomyces tsukubensis TaxID=83656 RepID=UPI00098F7C2D|nr:PspC domain-containing protein [Streptomyces tsukubensis]QFR95315.1 PspC domain-containing protein [Streptomyces tsukubensis]
MTDHQPAASAGQPDDGAAGCPPASRVFRRDRSHKMLAGVCAGLGRRCDMDPVIFRIILAVLSVTGGLGLIFYGFAWLLVPFDGVDGTGREEESEGRRLLSGRVEGSALTAVLCALVGCGLFLSMLNNADVLTFAAVLTLLTAGAGYWSQQRETAAFDPVAAQTVADAPPEAQAPPVPAGPSWWRDPILKDGTHVGGTGYFWGPAEFDIQDTAAGGRADARAGARAAPLAGGGRGWEAAAAARRRGSRGIGGRVTLAALLVGGIGTGLTWNAQPLGTSLQTGLACALAVFGIGLAVSAFLGRTGFGSLVLTLLTAALLAGAAALPDQVSKDWVRTDWRPTTASSVRPGYSLGSGIGTLDLSDVSLKKGAALTTRAEVGAGQIKVIVPADVTVRLTADVGMGDIRLPDEAKDDVDISPRQERKVTLSPEKGHTDGGTLTLRMHVGVGQVEVARATS